MSAFDPIKYKETTRAQWDAAAEAWHRWGPTLSLWLGPATEIMFDMAGVAAGHKVLDIAAGAGEQSLAAARRVGPTGRVLATDISANILAFARDAARLAGLSNIETRVMDGEALEVADGSFDVAISRVGLIYFPDQHRALTGIRRALKPGGRVAAMTYSTADKNPFFSIPVSIIRERARLPAPLPAPLPGQPGPFSLGAAGVIERLFETAGFSDVHVRAVVAPLTLNSAAECVRFERESFGALHQMLGGMAETERQAVWQEIERALRQFERPHGFAGPCEMLVAVGTA